MKRTVGVIALVALAAGACGGEDGDDGGAAGGNQPGPRTYTVAVDAPSPEGKNIQLSAYFPGSVTVHPGDTVVFDNRSTQAPHTVTFGIDGDRSNMPRPITPEPAFNPVVFGPCTLEEDPSADLVECPPLPAGDLPSYRGTGYWNSGALVPVVAEGPKQVRVTFDETTPPGRYPYACVLHAFMGGEVVVAAAGGERDDPGEVATLAGEQAADAMAAAEAIPEPEPVAGQVFDGWGDQLTAVNRFLPEVMEVRVGETLTWRTASPYEPHTVTFESPFALDDPAAVPPGGVPSGGDYAGGFSNSGFVGPPPFPVDTFSLRFTRAGEYPYVCVLHPGMTGTVRVT